MEQSVDIASQECEINNVYMLVLTYTYVTLHNLVGLVRYRSENLP